MNPGEAFKAITELGQSTNGGFTVIALIALVVTFLLYRGVSARLDGLVRDLQACNNKHDEGDRSMAALRDKLGNVAVSTASLWTIASLSRDRVGYELPPLNEVLDGRMVIQLRAASPSGVPPPAPFVYSAASPAP